MAALIRTNRGRLEAFNPRSLLSDDLKLLIKFIDGKRHYSDLQQALKPHICSKEKIQQLIELGLVETHELFQKPNAHAEINSTAFLPTAPAGLSAFGMLQSHAAFSSEASAAEVAIDDDPDSLQSLNTAKDCMADFLLRYAPNLAFEVLGEIEGLTSIPQLQASLSTYTTLIGAVVSEVQKNQHLLQLRSILSSSTLPTSPNLSP